jgi:hypothetical protein
MRQWHTFTSRARRGRRSAKLVASAAPAVDSAAVMYTTWFGVVVSTCGSGCSCHQINDAASRGPEPWDVQPIEELGTKVTGMKAHLSSGCRQAEVRDGRQVGVEAGVHDDWRPGQGAVLVDHLHEEILQLVTFRKQHKHQRRMSMHQIPADSGSNQLQEPQSFWSSCVRFAGARGAAASTYHDNVARHSIVDAAGLRPSSFWVPQHQLAVSMEAEVGCSHQKHSLLFKPSV